MVEFEEARQMLELARRDLATLGNMTDEDQFEDYAFGLFAQQAVEKALKAWISALNLEYPLTHAIAKLLSILDDANENVDDFLDLADLTAFAANLETMKSEIQEKVK